MAQQEVRYEIRDVVYIDKVRYQKMEGHLSPEKIEELIESVHQKMQKTVENIGFDFSEFTFDRRRERACRKLLNRFEYEGWFSMEKQSVQTSMMAETELDANDKSYEVLAEWRMKQDDDGEFLLIPEITVLERIVTVKHKCGPEFICFPYDPKTKTFTRLKKLLYASLDYYTDEFDDNMPESVKEHEWWFNQIGRKMTDDEINTFVMRQMEIIEEYAQSCGVLPSSLVFPYYLIKNVKDELKEVNKTGYFKLGDRRRLGVEGMYFEDPVTEGLNKNYHAFMIPWELEWNPETNKILMITHPRYENNIGSGLLYTKYLYDKELGDFEKEPFATMSNAIAKKYKGRSQKRKD